MSQDTVSTECPGLQRIVWPMRWLYPKCLKGIFPAPDVSIVFCNIGSQEPGTYGSRPWHSFDN